ncbi:MAG: hypothetical protein J6334_07125, partial [Kiritimatiellae bacterium]|nr:hypothetical protein [Kiritimatiellia bacterium]
MIVVVIHIGTVLLDPNNPLFELVSSGTVPCGIGRCCEQGIPLHTLDNIKPVRENGILIELIKDH